MAGEKFLKHSGGSFVETESVQVGGSGSEDKIPSLDSAGRLDTTMMPTGIGADTQLIEASESLSAGDLVNIWNDGGTPKVRKADATSSGKEAHGFVIAAVTSGANATVYFEGNNEQVTGLTAGKLYLSSTAGGVSNTAPSSTGNVVQVVGFATAAASMNFNAGPAVVLA